MSTAYKILCLNHDPALVITDLDREHHEPFVPNREDAQLASHRGCDIMIGAFSYPLVQVGCYGLSVGDPTRCRGNHSQIIWVEVAWLRLLYAANGVLASEVTAPLGNRCWTPERLARLAPELSS
jgi:hypothetical protein